MDRQKLAKQYSCASHTGRRLVEAITEGVDDPVLSIRVQVGMHRQTENMCREMLRIGRAARRDRILSISGLTVQRDPIVYRRRYALRLTSCSQRLSIRGGNGVLRPG